MKKLLLIFLTLLTASLAANADVTTLINYLLSGNWATGSKAAAKNAKPNAPLKLINDKELVMEEPVLGVRRSPDLTLRR